MAEEGKVIACHKMKACKKQYKKEKRLIVVDFSASSKSPDLAELEKKMPNFKFLKVDVDELPSVARKWAVDAVPTFLLLKRGILLGKVVGRGVNEPNRS
uniref:Thioredoxin domain-containing protein n=1 Tax=Manihot esculenta TaxID=3983 RepID=A0A2C9UY80_MANES